MGWDNRNPELYDALYAGGYLSGPYAGINPERFECDIDESASLFPDKPWKHSVYCSVTPCICEDSGCSEPLEDSA